MTAPLRQAPTLQDLADRTGVSRATASRAMRADPRIGAETTRRVREAARALGYRPNALVSALMSHLRTITPPERATPLAYVTAFPAGTDWRENRTYAAFFDGARRRAERLGYRVEEFRLLDAGGSGRRLGSVLAARGVRGVLVAPLPPGVETIDLDWERFAAASVGYSMARPRLHLAANHQAHTVDLAVARLRAAGRRRIGLAVPEGDDRRVDHHWHSRFLWHHAQWPRAERVPVLGIGAWGEAAFRAWYARHRPDALLVVSGRPAGWLRGLGARATRRTPVAYLDWWPARAPAPGVDQHSAEVGAAAVDLVVGQLHRNESGPPPHPKTVLVEGVWRDPAAPA